MLRPALLLGLSALIFSGVAIIIFVVAHFMSAWTPNWVKVDGRIVESQSEWNSKHRRGEFCHRIQYKFFFKEREFTGTGLRPGWFHSRCQLSGRVQGVLISQLKVGQPVEVFVDEHNNTSVLDNSPVVWLPIFCAIVGLAITSVCAWGMFVVLKERKQAH